jgi:ribulose-phosphate 3-epimerase
MRTPLLKDVHLMVQDPLAKVDAFVAAGADLVTFHLEGAAQPLRVLQQLEHASNANDPARGIIKGVGINPSTPLEALEPLLDALDYVLVLAINPGWSGQHFLPGTVRRLERCRRLIEASGRPILLGVDGGVTRENAAYAASLGVDIVVSGSAIFDGTPAGPNARAMLDTIATGARTAVPA